ncbi:MAG: ATP-binding protein [Roseovarius sp.]
MRFAKITRRLVRRRAQLSVFTGLVIICLLAISFIGTQVFMKLDDYASASQDNVPWALSQLEVDQLKLLTALERLTAQDPESLRQVNQRFDAFYSRAGTVAVGRVYDPIQNDSKASQSLAQLQVQILEMEQIMDGSDGVILNNRDALITMTQNTADPIRRLMASGISLNAQINEAERNALTSKLLQVTVLSLLLLVAMASLGVLLWQLYRLYRHRALDNRQTLNRLATILDTSQDAVLVVCPDGCIIDTNRAANDMFFDGAAPPEHAMVSELLKRKDPDGGLSDVSGAALIASCAEGPNLCANLMAQTKDSTTFPVELSADTAMRGGDQVVICFLRNISRRLADQAALLAARDRALSGEQAKARFLSGISHEMRTPLTGILGVLDLLEDTELSEKQRGYAHVMQSSGQILLDQINDVLDMAQTDKGQQQVASDVFDLDALLDTLIAVCRPMARQVGSTLALTPNDAPLGWVRGDPKRVHQVLLNLVSNAIKFTHNGQVTLDACRLAADEAGLANTIEFQVIDTGIGIAEQDQARIFEDFVRLKETHEQPIEGTGLGLGIARNLVVLMNGEIGVESEPGEGSLFWVRLPLPVASVVHPLPETAAVQGQIGPQDILVVDDNDINRAVLSEMLEREGHRVWSASNGAEAVQACNTRRFDTVIMDINMPVMGGADATRAIRSSQGASCEARIVALSAHVSSDTQSDVLAAGVNAVLVKPLRREDLWQALSPGATAHPARAMPSNNVLDPAVLDQLTTGLDPETFTQLVAGVRQQGQALVDDLSKLNTDALPARLHDFAGLCATLGARALHAELVRAEQSLLSGDTARADMALAALPGLWHQTCAAVDQIKAAA